MTAFEARKITDEAINEKVRKNKEEVARLRAEIDTLIEAKAKAGGDRHGLKDPGHAVIKAMLISNLRNDGYKVERDIIYW